MTDPRARDIKVEPQRPQDGGEEGVVLHAVAAQPPFDNLMEQSIGVQRQRPVLRVMQSDIAPDRGAVLSQLQHRQRGQGVLLDF